MTIQRGRHGCLTAWLIFMLVGNSLGALGYILAGEAIREALPATSAGWVIPVLAVLSIANIVFAIALFQWQKWGFWGVVATSVAAFIINLSIGIGVGQSALGLIGIALLYGVLNIGDSNKGWPQLK